MSDNTTTLIGNLTEDPELRFTQGGHAVCTIRIAVNAWRGKDKDQATTFWNVTAWRDLGENVAESLSKGQRVVVVGELTQRSYENKEGQTVWVTEVEAQEIAPSLRWAQAKVERTSNSSSRPESRPAAPPVHDDDVPF